MTMNAMDRIRGDGRGSSFLVLLLLAGTSVTAGAQLDYGNRLGEQERGPSRYGIIGPRVLMKSLDPTIKRWYLPQELFREYGRHQWSYTNYARQPYLPYVSRSHEGEYFYDYYGNLVTRGWLVFDWHQTQARTVDSSRITKLGRYDSWFHRLIISSDATGDNSYSLTVGDEIFASLTPMTFRKAGFNGVMTDFASSRVRATGLFARPSHPVVLIFGGIASVPQSNYTNLMAGRLEADVTDFLTLGATFVNAHNAAGIRDSFQSNPLRGALTTGQLSSRVNLLLVRLRDDSPEDGEGGPILFDSDVEITTSLWRDVDVEGGTQRVLRDTTISGRSIGFYPAIEGGEVRDGFRRADGQHSITMYYTLAPEEGESEAGTLRLLLQRALDLDLSQADEAVTRIRNVRFRLRLANDYTVEVASDRQVNRHDVPQFLEVARAAGNVKNQLNPEEVVFDYGLPTATQIAGLTTEIRDLAGFDFYGEFNLSTSVRQYPSTLLEKHDSFSGIVGDEHALGFQVNLSKKAGPLRLFVEGFGMDDAYSTSIKPVSTRGIVDYSPEATEGIYDFVDDNDDQDRHPDQARRFHGGLIRPLGTSVRGFLETPVGVADPAVFPGYDENGDLISDFNQNSNGDQDNYFPDYEEPFLRHNSDRPEFLFGIDLDNNGVAERFENDDLPDYPYKKGHWGYNAHATLRVNPDLELTAGYLRQDLRGADRSNRTPYGLLELVRDDPGWGRLQLFDMFKLARDTISDPVNLWMMPSLDYGAAGQSVGVSIPRRDPLAAEDTWINSFAADWSYASPRGWSTRHRVKWDWWRQRNAAPTFAVDEEGAALLDEEGEPVVLFDPLGPEARNGRETSGFTGFINKADLAFQVGRLSLSPRIKSEWRNEVPFSRDEERRRSWDGIASLLVSMPFMARTHLEFGIEGRHFAELRADEEELAPGTLTGDFRGVVYAVQVANRRPWKSYAVTTQVGLRFDRRSLEVVEADLEQRTAGLAFVTVYAGL